jgi:glycine/D-amino acid oxidase-like deaminating enzyme
VVGAGVVGVLTSLRLLERGADVTLVDGTGPGAGTSGITFAHVNASYSGYWEYFELRAAGVAGDRRLRAELGETPWLHDRGYLQLDSAPAARAALAAHAERLRAARYPVARLPVESLPRWEARLHAPSEVSEVWAFPDEGYVDVPVMLSDVLRVAGAAGLTIRTGSPVEEVESRGQRAVSVRLRDRTRIPADVVVSCCGLWTDDLHARAGVHTSMVLSDQPTSPVAGLLVVTSPTPPAVNRVVAVDGVSVRPDPGGRTMLWSTEFDARLRASRAADPDARPPTASVTDDPVAWALAAELLAATRTFLPALADASVEQAHVALRAMPADGLPVVGWLPGVSGVYTVLAHAAVTLAPVLGEIAAAEIVAGTEDPRADRFRPTRLSGPPSPRKEPSHHELSQPS